MYTCPPHLIELPLQVLALRPLRPTDLPTYRLHRKWCGGPAARLYGETLGPLLRGGTIREGSRELPSVNLRRSALVSPTQRRTWFLPPRLAQLVHPGLVHLRAAGWGSSGKHQPSRLSNPASIIHLLFEPGDQSTIYSFASMGNSAFAFQTTDLQINY